MTQTSRVSHVPSVEQSLPRHPETRELYEEGFSWSLQAVDTEFKKLHEPKVAKFKGGYSSNTSLVFQSWLKDIWVYTIECHMLTPKEEQSFQGLIDHLSLTFQSCKTVSSLIANFYNWSQKTRRPKMLSLMSCKS